MKYFVSGLLLIVAGPCFAQEALPGEAFPSFAEDGAWCWFSDPRAVYFEGEHQRTYSGWVDSHGSIYVGYYDHSTGDVRQEVLYDKLEVDDHDNPALWIDRDGRIHVFFSKHADPFPMQLYISREPENITSWEEPVTLALNDTVKYKGLNNSYTYQNPIYLSDEKKLYLFWRGADFKPNYAVSADKGHTWTTGEILILPERIYKNRRPYMKVWSAGKDKIHFIFTDGHPANEPQNSVYYMYYWKGTFFKANGKKIKDIGQAPVDPAEADRLYDATQTGRKAWIWDIAEDEKGYPVIAYTKFPDDSNHVYCYARWTGTEWVSHELINSGGWFPENPEQGPQREPNYSGGITIDHENPSVLYLSIKRDGIYEIEQWTTPDQGQTWNKAAVTSGSAQDNVRPFAIRNAGKDNPLQVLWMNNTFYRHYTDYKTTIKMDLER